ncbi:hypothetical protein JZO81_21225 [Enterococcus hulanensis]|uniref:hypothetical protein n=1 Tax=Enterococcus TaxID=1350 RepID=UPI000B5A419C|nr:MULTISPECIES: hypothetical protein [Enterococcus]MBO0413588.1 hypothetical protein [Enterococcus hulanensis]OTO14297.1 hypothetical protein A5875_003454 [Enterococcus sp. 3H8_DIV0648]
MKKYNALEKQQIMLKSDLLEHSFTSDERGLLRKLDDDKLIDSEQLASISIDEELKMKVMKVLGQGMRLGLELEKLSQRGIEIIFPSQQSVPATVMNRFSNVPELLFLTGNKELLSDEGIGIVTSYTDFKNIEKPIIFIADRKMDKLLRFPDISDQLTKGRILLLSDRYRNNATKKEESVKLKEQQGRKKVFISGSRSQADIPENVQKSLELIRKQSIEVLIGDSEKGVDREIIDYLRLSPRYPFVEIFTIKKMPRVKVENEWQTKTIFTDSSLKPQEQQMVKDRAMADAADWGLAIFKPITKNRYGAIQVSSGTLRNTIQLLLDKKAVKFFYVFDNKVEVANLKTIADLKSVIEKYKEETLTSNEMEEILSSKGVEKDAEPSNVKYTKINKKFEELLKNEQKLQNDRSDSRGKPRDEQISLFG